LLFTTQFRFVVGILHTNYGAYIRQYGMGTSLVTAPALNALSALVIKAYCHRVIRLSATLTSFDSSLEVTCNVHGVRSEFLDEPEPKTKTTSTTSNSQKNAPVYFVGKLIWAKGFDKVLEVQELFHEATGEYLASRFLFC
jgi:digalactosyldiacylglycerol synthase